jgi:Zn-dependent metalloprotease
MNDIIEVKTIVARIDKTEGPMYRRILLYIFIGFSVGHVNAQQRLSVTATPVGPSSPGTRNFYYANRNEPPRAIEFQERTITAAYFLANINRYFDIPDEFTFTEEEKTTTDDLGMRHRVLQQYYKGIPLEGMGYRVHEKDGFITAANGKAVRRINFDTQTAFSEVQAFHLAINYLNSKDTTIRQGKKLIVSKNFTFTPESFSVAFQFDINVSLIERWRISIDARNGQLINKVSLVNSCFKEEEKKKENEKRTEITQPLPYGTGTGLTNYYGRQTIRVENVGEGSRLEGRTANGGIISTYSFGNRPVILLLLGFPFSPSMFYSSDNTYNDPYQKPGVSVQWAAEQAYEYYFKKHNRNSFDNNGGAIKSYVHVDERLDNAFWTGELMAFGDGSNNNPLVELDVVAHELTHGVTQHEAQLQYAYEPGALNESFSDIFGKAIEFATFGDTATWQLSKHYRNGGLRDMSNPNLKNQPDTYTGDLWYTGDEDSGGVHVNSGVQNFWYYLLCKGGSGINDQQVSYSVNAVGMDVTTKIAYRNLTEYLSPLSDYLDSRIGSLLATADLFGKNSAVYQEVDKAWDAVGVIEEPIITSLEIYDITATTIKVKGGLIPRSDIVTYHVEYGTTPAFGNSSSISNYTDTVADTLTGLQPSTKYYLRLVATNENGSSYATKTFTTISLAPLVKIKHTVDVTETTATLYGSVNPNSLPTSFHFEYGLTPALGLVTASYPMPDTTEFLTVSAPVINLLPRRTYYYRLVATNSFSLSATGAVSFFTAVKPVINSYSPVTAPIGTEVTITGLNFNSVPGMNLVSFGATRATVLYSSSTEIKVKVPAGASFGPITLLDAESGLTAESVREFVPTFTGTFKKGSLQLRVGTNDPYIYKTIIQDMDGDNKPDIVASYFQGLAIFQNVNQGGDITDASFIRSTYQSDYTNSFDISLADFDGNGLKDVVMRYQNGLRIYPNLSVPGYLFFGVPVDLPVGYLGNLIFNDFDGDGHIDIGGSTYLGINSSMVTLIRNQNPKGSLSANNFQQQYTKRLHYAIHYLSTGDLNNDAKPDLIIAPVYSDFLSILENNSRPGIFEFEQNLVQDPTNVARSIQVGSHDLNNDGWRDIITYALSQNGNTAILENKGTSPNVTLSTPVVALTESDPIIQYGDINGDGSVDLLAALSTRKFIFFENNVETGEQFLNSSFQKFEAYGMPVVNGGSVKSYLSVGDLNGDGRPEVISAHSYYYGPHDGYQMEIWQNASDNCLDPSGISLNASNYTATIVLPPNTTLDQFQIEYTSSGHNAWSQVFSTTLHLSPGYSYQLRARAKCHLAFTDYYYINFETACVDMTGFSISSIGAYSVSLNPSDLTSFEVQYSPLGRDQWETQYSNQIINLLPGTTYRLRFRGRCPTLPEFRYTQFTTLCPKLSDLTVTNATYNTAVVNYRKNNTGNVILEYSKDNVNWILINETQTMSPLIPGTLYFVRGSLACTNINSDFIYTSFITPCPKVSTVNVNMITPHSARIIWVDRSDADSYTLTYSMVPGGNVTTVQTNSTSVNLEGLTPGTNYTVAVAPQCILANDFMSTTFSTVCYAPGNLSVNGVTHTTAELSWIDTFSSSSYFVDYAMSGSNIWLTKETASTNISLAELRPGTEYEARVHLNCISVTPPYVSLRFKTDLYKQIMFAPNPTDNSVTIYPSKNLIGNRYSIYDNAGKKVADAELLDYTIDLSFLSPGIYTLKIDGEKTMKVVKQ